MIKTIPSKIYTQIASFLGKDDFSYTIDNQGCDNIVYIIEDQYILRASKDKDHSFDQEIQIINYLSKYTDIHLPVPILCDSGNTRFMYQKIEGSKTDTNNRINMLSKKSYNNLVKQLANFLVTLHSLAYKRPITKIGIKSYDKSWGFYNNLKNHLFQINDDKILKFSEEIIAQYETYYSNDTPIILGLLHNDIYGNHFFTNLDTGDITGIIDFTDATIGDIQLDFIFLYDPEHNLRSDVIDSYCKNSNHNIDKVFVLLCTKIFITYHYLKYKDNTNERAWAEKWILQRIKS